MNHEFYDENTPYGADLFPCDEDDSTGSGIFQVFRSFLAHFSPRIMSVALIALIILVACTISDWKYNHTEPVIFSQTAEPDVPVYTDIVSIEPVYGIYSVQVRRGRHYVTRSHFTKITHSTESDYDPINDLNYPNCSKIVCKCETVEGNVIWVELSRLDYEEFFDPTPTGTGQRPIAILGSASFEEPVRLLGKSRETEDVAEGFERLLNVDMVVLFKSIDA